MNRTELVLAARDSISQGSKSFRMASRLFDRTTRERAWLLYCWCRHCDDVCDGQDHGHASETGPQGSVAEVEALTRRALGGEETGLLPFDALAALRAECAVPDRYVIDHLDGFRLDAEGWRPRSEEDLLRYCYHVAGAVGCMMAVVMGVDPDDETTLRRASDLGIAFQLSNIARDIADDHGTGRCYIPTDWLDTEGLDAANMLDPASRARLVGIVRRLCDLAERFEASSRLGIGKLPFRSRWAIHSAAGIYGQIGRRVAELGDRAWDSRVTIPRREKAAIMLSALRAAART